MKGMHGIIFSYEKQTDLRELIANRIHGSIPFGGDYRVTACERLSDERNACAGLPGRG